MSLRRTWCKVWVGPKRFRRPTRGRDRVSDPAESWWWRNWWNLWILVFIGAIFAMPQVAFGVAGKEAELVPLLYFESVNIVNATDPITLAFSKKLGNFEATVGLHFAYYNLVKRHNSFRCTPAMAAGVERDVWSVGDLIEAAA